MPQYFDEARLDDAEALARADVTLRSLASAGPRVRREAVEAAEAISSAVAMSRDDRPRAVVAAGPDSRLLRAVLEPACPVPFVAWPNAGLPGWAGPLDLVVILAPDGGDVATAMALSEAVRRGCRIVVACPENSLVGTHAVGRSTTVLPTSSGDQLAVAVVMLQFLSRIGLGPQADADEVAEALDEVAVACSPHRDLSINPAKAMAICLADARPLFWGGSVLAARAGRRIAEAVRRSTGRTAVAGDAEHLLPLLASAPPRDLFSDPFADSADDAEALEPRPVLILLDDGASGGSIVEQRTRLSDEALAREIRVELLSAVNGSEVARYASLLGQGRWAASYLALGLGRV